MSMRYEVRRAGAHNGKWYSRGNQHELPELPETVLARWLEQRRIVARPEVDEVRDEVPEWPLKTDPEKYLECKPDGKNAELARLVLAAREEEPTIEESEP